jgi:hypothetical protein
MMIEQDDVFIQTEHSEIPTTLVVQKLSIALFVDRRSQQWIARDVDGKFWVVPPVDHPWENRQPFEFTEETQLEPVPGHYKFMLGVPN